MHTHGSCTVRCHISIKSYAQFSNFYVRTETLWANDFGWWFLVFNKRKYWDVAVCCPMDLHFVSQTYQLSVVSVDLVLPRSQFRLLNLYGRGPAEPVVSLKRTTDRTERSCCYTEQVSLHYSGLLVTAAQSVSAAVLLYSRGDTFF